MNASEGEPYNIYTPVPGTAINGNVRTVGVHKRKSEDRWGMNMNSKTHLAFPSVLMKGSELSQPMHPMHDSIHITIDAPLHYTAGRGGAASTIIKF